MKQKLSYFLTALMCMLGTSAWALEKDADGIYQIGTAEDLVAFSELVNGGENTANAVLTADIDMAGESANFQPIGAENALFSGTFDGQDHRIKNLKISLERDCVGLFGIIQSPAAIRNLILDETCSIETNGSYCAMIGQARGANGPIYMENLGMEGNVKLTGKNGGGIIGNNMGSVAHFQMKNCYVTGNVIAGNNSGLITGYAGPQVLFENCWGTGEVVGHSGDNAYLIRGVESGTITNCYSKNGTQANKITDEQVSNGALCFMLNGDQSEMSWYQTLGEDSHPVLDASHGLVYTMAERRCDGQIIGEGTFSNDASQQSAIPEHQYENDVCTVCGQFNSNFLEMKDGFYQIADGAQLVKFMRAVNAGNNKFNAQLTADIDMTEESANFQPIGTETSIYAGTFDGQGHRIKNLKISIARDCVGVFGMIQSPAVIKNFVLDESCSIEAQGNYCATIGQARGAGGPIYMENLGMEGTIHLTGFNGGGIIGNNMGSVANFKVKNCYVTGNVSADGGYSGALTGWAGGGATFENCWVIGEVHGTDGPDTYFIRGLESGTITNCYSKYGTQVTVIDDNQVASGNLCYMLNGGQSLFAWYQTLGEDAHPVLNVTHGKVYTTAELRCDGQIIGEGTFSNDASQASVIPDHKYENGVCTICGQKQEGFMEPDADGFYNISEASQLVWFAMAVNNGGGNLNARLTADIDMTDENDMFTPIGSATSLYSGTFDGQGHRIMNLNISLDRDCVGLFGIIQSPATIRNLILDETCSIETNGNYCALIGQARGAKGPIYMENLGMEGNVTLTGKNGGGIIGNNMGSVAYFQMKNCYVTGQIKTGGSSGLLTGYAGHDAVFENCWGTGEVDGVDGDDKYFIRGMEWGSISNCYSKNGTQVKIITDEQVWNGELCYLLNGESFFNPSWFQTLGDDLHPVFDSTHGTVYKAGDFYADVHDEASFAEFKDAFLASERSYCEEIIAEQKLIDQYAERIEAMGEYNTIQEFAAAYNEFRDLKSAVESSAAAYVALLAKVDEVKAYLEEHDDFEGEKRDQLEYYLTEYEEPGELYINGTSLYILETHTMNEADVRAEIARIDQMKEEAIATGFTIHADVSTLLVNADFSSGWNGWEGTLGNATSSPAAECKNSTCDFHQTLTDLRNGVYELQVNGFFRPGNPTSSTGNLTSTNYGAFFYINDMQNYLMAAIEDMIGANEAVDGENCFITEGASWTDFSIYNDNGDLLGYVPGGQGGINIAAQAGRYQNRILVNVTDGTLTVGFRQPGTGVANDCMDITNLKLFYHGTLEEASAEVDEALACMSARAKTLYDYEASIGSDYAQYPNYSAELHEALKTAIDAVGTTTDVEGKYALMGTFSNLFQQIYENKKMYVALMDEAETLVSLSEFISAQLSEEDVKALNDAITAIYTSYMEGTITKDMLGSYIGTLSFMPKVVDGVYQIGDAAQLNIFSTIVNNGDIAANGVLTADIDMTGFNELFIPIGNQSTKYCGTFDGQGHRIKNLNISLPQERVGLFGVIQSPAVIRDFIIDASCTIEGGGNYGGIIGSGWGNGGPVRLEKLGMEGTIHLTGYNGGGIIGNNQDNSVNIHMSNCYVSGNVTADGGYSGALTGWAGAGAAFENCWVIGQVSGTDSDGTYFIRGLDSGTITNCYCKYGTQVNPLTDEQVASGELCYLLNGDQSEIVWYQNIGEDPHPVFDATHKTVVKNEDGSYDNITAIETVQSEESKAQREIYDLSGRKISGTKLSKGIYIINGKKVAIK